MNIGSKEIILDPIDDNCLITLCGPLDNNIKEIEYRLGVIINRYHNIFKIIGNEVSINTAAHVLKSLYSEAYLSNNKLTDIGQKQIYLSIVQNKMIYKNSTYTQNNYKKLVNICLKDHIVKPRTLQQIKYINNILNYDIIFGVGPAGTGKTYLAVAAAVQALEHQKVSRLLLTRPAVEVGEKLGFLPGDIHEKINPYLRPLYDALFEMLGNAVVYKFIEQNIIEVAPLAYMRGRTLNDTFMILDESQNTTILQMKMFLTRLGFHSKAIITGDVTQIDLPANQRSGLCHAIKILNNIKSISFNFFHEEDIVRHPIVADIVKAYKLNID